MTRFGIFLAIFGAGSFLLNLAGQEFVLLMWIDNWGTVVGNLIRIGLIVGGIGLAIAGMVTSKGQSEGE